MFPNASGDAVDPVRANPFKAGRAVFQSVLDRFGVRHALPPLFPLPWMMPKRRVAERYHQQHESRPTLRPDTSHATSLDTAGMTNQHPAAETPYKNRDERENHRAYRIVGGFYSHFADLVTKWANDNEYAHLDNVYNTAEQILRDHVERMRTGHGLFADDPDRQTRIELERHPVVFDPSGFVKTNAPEGAGKWHPEVRATLGAYSALRGEAVPTANTLKLEGWIVICPDAAKRLYDEGEQILRDLADHVETLADHYKSTIAQK